MSHEGSAEPIANDGPRFHLNIPVCELTEGITRAIEASDISSTPMVAKTTDSVIITKSCRPLVEPPLCAGAR